MICSNCQTINDGESVFCVNCGNNLRQASGPVTVNHSEPAPTIAVPAGMMSSPPQIEPQTFQPAPPTSFALPQMAYDAPQRGSSTVPKALIAVLSALLVVAGAIAVYLFVSNQGTGTGSLPDHFGMFAQSDSGLTEIRKTDYTNAISARDAILKDDSLPALDANPAMIMYLDGKDVPVNDLRLVQIDKISDDGRLQQLDFQVSPIDGKPEMKRLRVPDGVAAGRYAFALLDGYLDEGKHKFWAFQVKSSNKNDNGAALKTSNVAVRNATVARSTTQPSAPSQYNPAPPPPGGSVAYSTTSRLVLRSGPSQASSKIRNLGMNEKVYVIEYSSNYETFRNLYSNFAYVQTENGQRGWAYAAYLK